MIGPKTEELIRKLDDAGIDREEAIVWIEEVVAEAAALPTHSCSCHTKNDGACGVCKEIGCEVWNFNRVSTIPVS